MRHGLFVSDYSATVDLVNTTGLVDDAETLRDLEVPPGNRLEALKGDRLGQYSIRINSQYRICFRWTDRGPQDVEIVDYHS
jgi:toxin HigB-1